MSPPDSTTSGTQPETPGGCEVQRQEYPADNTEVILEELDNRNCTINVLSDVSVAPPASDSNTNNNNRIEKQNDDLSEMVETLLEDANTLVEPTMIARIVSANQSSENTTTSSIKTRLEDMNGNSIIDSTTTSVLVVSPSLLSCSPKKSSSSSSDTTGQNEIQEVVLADLKGRALCFSNAMNDHDAVSYSLDPMANMSIGNEESSNVDTSLSSPSLHQTAQCEVVQEDDVHAMELVLSDVHDKTAKDEMAGDKLVLPAPMDYSEEAIKEVGNAEVLQAHDERDAVVQQEMDATELVLTKTSGDSLKTGAAVVNTFSSSAASDSMSCNYDAVVTERLEHHEEMEVLFEDRSMRFVEKEETIVSNGDSIPSVLHKKSPRETGNIKGQKTLDNGESLSQGNNHPLDANNSTPQMDDPANHTVEVEEKKVEDEEKQDPVERSPLAALSILFSYGQTKQEVLEEMRCVAFKKYGCCHPGTGNLDEIDDTSDALLCTTQTDQFYASGYIGHDDVCADKALFDPENEPDENIVDQYDGPGFQGENDGRAVRNLGLNGLRRKRSKRFLGASMRYLSSKLKLKRKTKLPESEKQTMQKIEPIPEDTPTVASGTSRSDSVETPGSSDDYLSRMLNFQQLRNDFFPDMSDNALVSEFNNLLEKRGLSQEMREQILAKAKAALSCQPLEKESTGAANRAVLRIRTPKDSETGGEIFESPIEVSDGQDNGITKVVVDEGLGDSKTKDKRNRKSLRRKVLSKIRLNRASSKSIEAENKRVAITDAIEETKRKPRETARTSYESSNLRKKPTKSGLTRSFSFWGKGKKSREKPENALGNAPPRFERGKLKAGPASNASRTGERETISDLTASKIVDGEEPPLSQPFLDVSSFRPAVASKMKLDQKEGSYRISSSERPTARDSPSGRQSAERATPLASSPSPSRSTAGKDTNGLPSSISSKGETSAMHNPMLHSVETPGRLSPALWAQTIEHVVDRELSRQSIDGDRAKFSDVGNNARNNTQSQASTASPVEMNEFDSLLSKHAANDDWDEIVGQKFPLRTDEPFFTPDSMMVTVVERPTSSCLDRTVDPNEPPVSGRIKTFDKILLASTASSSSCASSTTDEFECSPTHTFSEDEDDDIFSHLSDSQSESEFPSPEAATVQILSNNSLLSHRMLPEDEVSVEGATDLSDPAEAPASPIRFGDECSADTGSQEEVGSIKLSKTGNTPTTATATQEKGSSEPTTQAKGSSEPKSGKKQKQKKQALPFDEFGRPFYEFGSHVPMRTTPVAVGDRGDECDNDDGCDSDAGDVFFSRERSSASGHRICLV